MSNTGLILYMKKDRLFLSLRIIFYKIKIFFVIKFYQNSQFCNKILAKSTTVKLLVSLLIALLKINLFLGLIFNIMEFFMKKIVIASAITVVAVSSAHAAPTVYGKAFLATEYANTDYENPKKDDKSSTQLVSNSSRIGFKGDEELMNGTNIIYQLEYGVDIDADNNGKGQFYSRNTFLGLQNNQYGTILAGRHDTPFKLAKGSVDVFNDYGSVELGKLMYGENRANNVIAYKSPTIVGMPITFLGAISLDECEVSDDKCLKTAATATTPAVYRDKTNAYSAMVNYDQNGVYLGAGYDKDVAGADTSAWRLAGSVDMGKMNMVQGLALGALYQQADFNTNADEKAWLLSGKYKVGETPWAVKVQYIDTKNKGGAKDTDATEVALGAEYSFNKATKAHLYAAQISTDKPAVNANEDKTIVGAGLEYKF